MTQSRDLFSDFEALSDEAWRAKVIKDLKGKDFEETLVWKDELGIVHQPYYRQSDLENNSLVDSIQAVQKNNATWAVFQSFDGNAADLKSIVENALANGVDEVQIRATEDDIDYEQLLGDEIIQNSALRIRFNAFPDLSKVNAFYIDPIATYLKSGQKPAPFESPLIEIFKAKSNTSADRFLLVDGSIYKNAGANVVEELALSLHHAVEYFDLMTKNGFTAAEIAQKMTFKLAFGSSYFTEIAKGRAFRYLSHKMHSAYGIEQEAFVWGEGSWSDLAHKDPYTNLLRTTTQSMAAVLGNCDAVSALTFDELQKPSTLGIRMAKNIQLILKEEAYMAQSADMASGSYYVEHLSAEIAEKAWEKFLAIEEKGGLLTYFESGALQSDLDKSIQNRLEKFKSKKRKMVGVNSYENEAADEMDLSLMKSQEGKGLKKFLLAKEID